MCNRYLPRKAIEATEEPDELTDAFLWGDDLPTVEEIEQAFEEEPTIETCPICPGKCWCTHPDV